MFSHYLINDNGILIVVDHASFERDYKARIQAREDIERLTLDIERQAKWRELMHDAHQARLEQ
jgi:hypothetical protein